MDRMPDITDDSRLWDKVDTVSAMRAKQVENCADWHMAGCADFHYSQAINLENDLYDGDLLPMLMTEIANWTGRSDDAAERMRKLHNLLAGEFQKIAEREVEV